MNTKMFYFNIINLNNFHKKYYTIRINLIKYCLKLNQIKFLNYCNEGFSSTIVYIIYLI